MQPAPFNKSKSILLSLMYGPYGSPCSPVNEMSNIHGNGSLAPVCFSTVAIILAHSSENNSVSSSHVPHEQFHFASLNFVLTFFLTGKNQELFPILRGFLDYFFFYCFYLQSFAFKKVNDSERLLDYIIYYHLLYIQSFYSK